MVFNVIHCSLLSLNDTMKIVTLGGVKLKNRVLVNLKREEVALIIHALKYQRDMFGDLLNRDSSEDTDEITDMHKQLKKLHDKLLLFTNK